MFTCTFCKLPNDHNLYKRGLLSPALFLENADTANHNHKATSSKRPSRCSTLLLRSASSIPGSTMIYPLSPESLQNADTKTTNHHRGVLCVVCCVCVLAVARRANFTKTACTPPLPPLSSTRLHATPKRVRLEEFLLQKQTTLYD